MNTILYYLIVFALMYALITNVFNEWKMFFYFIIGLIAYKIIMFYAYVFKLPPGPIPVPIFGNLMLFKGSEKHWTQDIERIAKRYGPVMTLWLGARPTIHIMDVNLAKEVFNKSDFSGRDTKYFGNFLSNEKLSAIQFQDFGPKWMTLRRLAHAMVNKYSTSEALINQVIDCVDQTIDAMIAGEGLDKPFVPFHYIYYMLFNIMATICYGKSYDINDDEYKRFKYLMYDMRRGTGVKWKVLNFLMNLRLFDMNAINRSNVLVDELIGFITEKFQTHYELYDKSVVRDFCDALIAAKYEALRDGKESAPYLTDENMALVIFDLMLAGTGTSHATFVWLLLFSLYYPKIGQKLRKEIETEIGDRMPTHEDRSRCHYVMAFISETLRFRNAVPKGLVHKAVVDSKIGNYAIPKGTTVCAFQGFMLNDEKCWSQPDQFIPERFLENGEFVTTRPAAYLPFGVGRRVCVGDKLAIADLFLVLVRFMQRTGDYVLKLDSDKGLEPYPYTISEAPFDAQEYSIVISNRK